MTTTFHYTNDRSARETFIIENIGMGKPIFETTIDRGHRNGPETFTITSTAIVIVNNARTGKLITKLIARPNQIRRFYESKNEVAPAQLIRLASYHQKMGWNEK